MLLCPATKKEKKKKSLHTLQLYASPFYVHESSMKRGMSHLRMYTYTDSDESMKPSLIAISNWKFYEKDACVNK